MFSLNRLIKRLIREELAETMPDVLDNLVVSLDPRKSYIVVIPSDLDFESVRQSLQSLGSDINVMLVQSDQIRLIEFE